MLISEPTWTTMKNERGIYMKKLICLLLALCLLPAFVFAEYSEKTDEEIKADFRSLVDEMISRGIWMSDVLPAGIYVVGVSIPVGSYELIPQKYGTIQMYSSIDALKNHEKRILFDQIYEGEPYILTLTEGVCFNLESTCAIKPLAFSW